jgi:hypothetical protein
MMTVTTPALLFPAISLLLLAYTNRFLVLAQLIRQLNHREGPQVRDLAKRQIAGKWCFGASLAALVLSLAVSLFEIQISCNAINIELESMENRS